MESRKYQACVCACVHAAVGVPSSPGLCITFCLSLMCRLWMLQCVFFHSAAVSLCTNCPKVELLMTGLVQSQWVNSSVHLIQSSTTAASHSFSHSWLICLHVAEQDYFNCFLAYFYNKQGSQQNENEGLVMIKHTFYHDQALIFCWLYLFPSGLATINLLCLYQYWSFVNRQKHTEFTSHWFKPKTFILSLTALWMLKGFCLC